jgi:hypothetical protein
MSTLFFGPQGTLGTVSGDVGDYADYQRFNDYLATPVAAGTMTPGYTGGNPFASISGMTPDMQGFFVYMEGRDERERRRQLEDWQRIRAMRKEEAQEAYQMQLPFKIAGAVNQTFANIAAMRQPFMLAEAQLRAQTPQIIANTAVNNPYANRRWFS